MGMGTLLSQGFTKITLFIGYKAFSDFYLNYRTLNTHDGDLFHHITIYAFKFSYSTIKYVHLDASNAKKKLRLFM